MDVHADQSADSGPWQMPLLDVTGLSLTELLTSSDTVLARSIQERLADVNDTRNPVLSAFGSFVAS